MSQEKILTLSPSDDSAVEWEDGRGRKRKLTLQELMALSEADREKLRTLALKYQTIPAPRGRPGLLITRKIYYMLNRSKCRKWDWENPDKIKENSRIWYLRNKKRNHERTARNRKLNRKRYLETARISDRRRRRTNIQAALRSRLSCRIKEAFRTRSIRKLTSFLPLLGCTVGFAMDHIAAQFKPGMRWGIWGNWHVDHIVPIAVFNLEDWEEACWCFNWRNLQPLWGSENQSKGSKLILPLPTFLPAHIAGRIVARVRQRRSSVATGAPSPHP